MTPARRLGWTLAAALLTACSSYGTGSLREGEKAVQVVPWI